MVSNSLLTWAGIAEVAAALRLAPAVMCVDAIQFSDPPLAALGECRRILVRGGRLAITGWKPTRVADERLSVTDDGARLAEQAISVVERADAVFFRVAAASIVPALQLLASLDTNPHP